MNIQTCMQHQTYWSKNILNDMQEKSIFFDPSNVPGVLGHLSGEKLQSLSARGCYMAQKRSNVIVTSHEAFEIANQIKKQLGELGFQGIGDFEISLDKRGKIFDEGIEPYGYFGSYFGNLELIEKYTQRIRWSEFFNNKVNFFDWMKQSGFGDIIPQTEVFLNKETLVSYLGNNEISGNWIKAGIGASGVGSWKIGGTGNYAFSKKELDSFDTQNRIERFFDDNGNIQKIENTESSPAGKSFEMGYIVQSGATGSEYSISFYVSDTEVTLITGTENITSGATHEGNRSIKLPDEVKQKIQNVANKMQETGYRGPVGFDFFYDTETEKIAILEANPRHTGATTPAIFCDRVSEHIGEVLQWSSGLHPVHTDSQFLWIPVHKLSLYR